MNLWRRSNPLKSKSLRFPVCCMHALISKRCFNLDSRLRAFAFRWEMACSVFQEVKNWRWHHKVQFRFGHGVCIVPGKLRYGLIDLELHEWMIPRLGCSSWHTPLKSEWGLDTLRREIIVAYWKKSRNLVWVSINCRWLIKGRPSSSSEHIISQRLYM